MRRFLPMLALAAAAVLPLADAAAAGEHEGWARGGWVQASEHERGRGREWARERGERGDHEERGGPPGWMRGRQSAPPAYERPPPQAFYPPPEPYGARSGLRRGGHLPPGIRGEAVPDLGRYRLRPPPPGYAWVRVGNAFVLMNTQTGQIFDMIAD